MALASTTFRILGLASLAALPLLGPVAGPRSAAVGDLASTGPAPEPTHSPTRLLERGGSAAAVVRATVPGATVPPPPTQNRLYQVPYNGRFTFTRVRYGGGGMGGGWRRGWSSAWNHDYPSADRNMQTILSEVTTMDPNLEGSNVVDLEDPEIFQHPILYMSEPGFWSVTERGARNLRAFLLKGGFIMFDDFEERQWDNMAAQVARALPEGEWVDLDPSHPIFRSFFHVQDIYVPHPLVAVTPNYRAIFEDNDPAKRVMVLANHNSDLAEYWEWSAEGYFPVDPSNDAYRLGVNYIVYALTH